MTSQAEWAVYYQQNGFQDSDRIFYDLVIQAVNTKIGWISVMGLGDRVLIIKKLSDDSYLLGAFTPHGTQGLNITYMEVDGIAVDLSEVQGFPLTLEPEL